MFFFPDGVAHECTSKEITVEKIGILEHMWQVIPFLLGNLIYHHPCLASCILQNFTLSRHRYVDIKRYIENKYYTI